MSHIQLRNDIHISFSAHLIFLRIFHFKVGKFFWHIFLIICFIFIGVFAAVAIKSLNICPNQFVPGSMKSRIALKTLGKVLHVMYEMVHEGYQ